MAVENEKSRLDDAARAGWLYYIAGNTQDEIARMLQVSRPTAQRLVSLCLAERLITFRLEHPIAACMELAARLKKRFDLSHCEVVPADPAAPQATRGHRRALRQSAGSDVCARKRRSSSRSARGGRCAPRSSA